MALLLGGTGAGIFGSLLGLGGGILIVPLLTLGAGLPIREAVGVSLVCVIVNSGAAAGVFLRRRTANLRLGMVLELSTAVGALIGGVIAFLLDERALAGLFAILLGYVAVSMARAARSAPAPGRTPIPTGGAGSAVIGEADPTPATGLAARIGGPDYDVRRLGVGSVGAVGAGVVSALLGVGGGIIMVPVMNLVMGVPLRVAAATSNMMIGVTATASAVVYLMRGGIDAYVAAPMAIGVFTGALVGSRVAGRIDVRLLRILFVGVQLYVAAQMALRAVGAP